MKKLLIILTALVCAPLAAFANQPVLVADVAIAKDTIGAEVAKDTAAPEVAAGINIVADVAIAKDTIGAEAAGVTG